MGRKLSLEQKWREQAEALKREPTSCLRQRARTAVAPGAPAGDRIPHQRMGIVAGIVATEVRQWQTTEPILSGTTDISATVKRAPATRIATQSIGPKSWSLTLRLSFGAASVSWPG